MSKSIIFYLFYMILILCIGKSSSQEELAGNGLELLAKAKESCRKEHSISQEQVQAFFDNNDQYNNELKCYMLCIFTKLDIWMEDIGGLDVTLVLLLVPPDLKSFAMKIGLRCLNVVGENHCDKALWYYTCWRSSKEKLDYLL